MSDFETFRKKVAEVETKELEKNREKIKRFDDAFRMMLLVITIIVAFGSNTFVGKTNLWGTIGFLFISLFLWLIGHFAGANSDSEF